MCLRLVERGASWKTSLACESVNPIINSILRRAFFVDVSEAVSPADKDDPYAPQSEVPDDCGLQCRMVAGVASVYRDQDAVDRNEALPLPCPRLSDFLADRAVLTRLISDGPV